MKKSISGNFCAWMVLLVILTGCGGIGTPVPDGGFVRSPTDAPKALVPWVDIWKGHLKNARTSTRETVIAFRSLKDENLIQIDYCYNPLLWIEGKYTYNDNNSGCEKPKAQILNDVLTLSFPNGDTAKGTLNADAKTMHVVYTSGSRKNLPLTGDLYRIDLEGKRK